MTDRLVITPPNEAIWHTLRHADVTSTESAALFGMSPYLTAFELWHRKQEAGPPIFDTNERMKWGTRLQDTIAAGIAEDYGVKIRPMREYVRLTEARMGASFDFEITGLRDGYGPAMNVDHTLRRMFIQHGPGILEIKNVDSLVFKQQWTEEKDEATGEVWRESPDHIEIQCQAQMHVSGHAWCAIGVLVGGNNPIVIVRERIPEVGAAIEARVRAFWLSIEENTPPPPTYPDDAKFVASLHSYAEPGKVYDGRGDAELSELAAEYQVAALAAKQAEENKQVAKARMLEKIGDAERVLLDRYKISASMVGPTHVEFDRAGFRGFRVTQLKERQTA